jgi:hypothetical protein
VLVVGSNNQGQRPYERYGVFKPIATTPPSIGDDLTIWGYGVDSQCPNSQAQQTSDGTVTDVGSTSIRHDTDATFGNSGSSLLRNGQEILGIATHCPCPNWATRFDHPAFAAARENLCPSEVPEDGTIISASVVAGFGSLVSGGIPELENDDGAFFVVDSLESGPRNNAMTVVTLQSPLTTVSLLEVGLEFGPSDASPVYLIVQIFNWDSGAYETLSIGIAASGGFGSSLQFEDLPTPNAYIDGSGIVQLRLFQTARPVQTPSGFTKLIDHVRVGVL